MLRPEDRNIRLRCRPKVVKRMQHAIAALGYQRTAIEIHAADTFGRPIGITAEQRIVFGRAEEPDNAQLLHQLVPQFLRAGFVQGAFL